MGRLFNGLMIIFRVVQVILSIVAFACAVYITSSMLSLSDSAQDLQTTIALFVNATEPSATSDEDLQNLHDGLKGAQKVLNPILEYFQGTPSRAITLTIVSAWSIITIVYVLVAQKRARTNPGMNKRSLRVALEILTLILWIGGIICAALLAAQYGALGILGGTQTKLFTTVLRKAAAKKAAQSSTPNDKALGESISVVDDLLTIGILSILAAGSSFICGAVSLISCIAACCISGKAHHPKRSKNGPARYDIEHSQPYDALQPLQQPSTGKKDAVFAVTEINTSNSWISTPRLPVVYTQNSDYHVVSTYDASHRDPRDGQPGS